MAHQVEQLLNQKRVYVEEYNRYSRDETIPLKDKLHFLNELLKAINRIDRQIAAITEKPKKKEDKKKTKDGIIPSKTGKERITAKDYSSGCSTGRRSS
jgi:DNA gyrase/topoisomerase IV subunit A